MTASATELHIDRGADGAVVVRRDTPAGKPGVATAVLAVLVVALCLVPVAVLWAVHGGWPIRAVAAVMAAAFTWPLAGRFSRQYAAGTTGWVLRADRGGLTVEATTWRGRTVRQFARGQVADVTLDCCGSPDPQHAVFQSMLIVRPTVGRPIRCLHNAGGDHLARAADALRAALGLPARSWP